MGRLSVQLDNVGIPEDTLKEALNHVYGNYFCERLLRQLVVQHLYLFPTRQSTKQKVCALLNIPIISLRGIDLKSRQEKLSPPKH